MRSATALTAALLMLCLCSADAAAHATRSAAAVSRAASPAHMAARAGDWVPSLVECSVTSAAPNVDLDCANPVLPTNEQHVAVDPRDPHHVIVTSNDYAWSADQFSTTLDGSTWSTGVMSIEDADRTGSDPVTAIDPRTGIALHASLNYVASGDGTTGHGDVVVSRSRDGGLTWGRPVVVGRGKGSDASKREVFGEEEWISVDTAPGSPFYGRAYLVWSAQRATRGEYVSSPIVEAHSDDAGKTWSSPQVISGASPSLCTFQSAGPAGACDEDQTPVAAIGPDGAVTVAFMNAQHEAAWEPGETGEHQYLVVRSTDGGERWSAPRHVVDLEDGSGDFPLNVHGEQTLTGLQARVSAAGGLAADPHSGELYVVFADDRAGAHDHSPAVTDINVYAMTSRDGRRWLGPVPVTQAPGDEFFPAAAVDPVTGQLGVAYLDRARGGDTYEAAFAYGLPGSFQTRRVSTAGSPVTKAAFFRAGSGSCAACTTYIGDRIGLAFGSDGVANVAWTDMRRRVDTGDVTAHGENSYFARLTP